MPVTVCEFCRSTVVRNGDQLASTGKVAALPDDISPLQIGTMGEAEGDRFTVIGRLRWRWSAGAWNEWLAMLDDGSQLWLGEAMGRFMVLREHDGAVHLPKTVAYGDKLTIGGREFNVMDVKTATHQGAEGNLPFAIHAGATMLSVDLADDEGRCASVQMNGHETSAYTGRYAELGSLKPSNLRDIPGWPKPAFAHG